MIVAECVLQCATKIVQGAEVIQNKALKISRHGNHKRV